MMDALNNLIDTAHKLANDGNGEMKAALDALYSDLGPQVDLNARQRMVFSLSLEDKSLRDIAEETGLPYTTVRHLSKQINDKLGVENKHAAVLQALRVR